MNMYYGIELPDLKRGDKDKNVAHLQCLLNGKGFDCGSVDGSYGPKTEAAVLLVNQSAGYVSKNCSIDTWKYLLNK